MPPPKMSGCAHFDERAGAESTSGAPENRVFGSYAENHATGMGRRPSWARRRTGFPAHAEGVVLAIAAGGFIRLDDRSAL